MNTYQTGMVAAVALAVSACGGGGGGSTAKTVAHGPITGFGSIIVAGVEYETESAEFEIEDESGGQDDLRVGQIVTVDARTSGGTRRADRVSYGAELKGPIASLDLPNSRFVALGRTVVVDNTTVFDGIAGLAALQVGDYVEVSGWLDGDGALRASYVEKEAPQTEVQIRGTVASHDGGTKMFILGTLTVDYAGASLDPAGLALADGMFVEAEGVLSDGVLMATEVELEDLPGMTAGVKVSIQGYVSAVHSATEFVLNGIVVRHGSGTSYVGGTADQIAPNVKVEAEGRIVADGSMSAQKIAFKTNSNIRVEAPVQAVDAGAGSVTVLGLEVRVTSSTLLRDKRDDVEPFALANLAPGDWAEIGATQQGSQIVALRLERIDAGDEVELRGPLTAVQELNDRIEILGVTVDVSGAAFRNAVDSPISKAQFFAAVSVGDGVEVDGEFDGSGIAADEVEIEP